MRDDSGRIIKPTPRNAAMQAYPMSRPLYLIVNDRPTGLVKVMVDLMLGLRGQEFIRKEGYFTKDDMEAAAPRNPRPEFEILPP
jgi:ABC-type phosphate transport system substrate-binding protein